MQAVRFRSTLESAFSLEIDLVLAQCHCLSHNGFLTRRGYSMKATSRAMGLTGPPRAVRVDMSLSVSDPESEAEVTSQKEEGSEGAPQDVKEVKGG